MPPNNLCLHRHDHTSPAQVHVCETAHSLQSTSQATYSPYGPKPAVSSIIAPSVGRSWGIAVIADHRRRRRFVFLRLSWYRGLCFKLILKPGVQGLQIP